MPIIITSKRHLFRRCGIAHPAEAVEYPDGRFTAAEIAAMQADPMLSVSVTEPDTADGQDHRASESADASTIPPDGPARRPDDAGPPASPADDEEEKPAKARKKGK